MSKRVKKEIIVGILSGLAVVVLGAAIMYRLGVIRMPFENPSDIGAAAAKAKITEFVGENMVTPGTEIVVSDPVEVDGLYNVTVTVAGKEHPVSLSRDGNTLFPNPIDIGKVTEKPAQAELPKADMPRVDLFVMSYCPYGTQIEKGILPVLERLGSSIDFNLRFVSYVMHDRKEVDENLRQYCVQKDAPEKLSPYLGCFLRSGEGTESACLSEAGIDAARVSACMNRTDDDFGISRDFADHSTYQGNFPTFSIDQEDNDRYDVGGSPTLVINGVVVDSSRRSPAALLQTLCSSYSTPPAACAEPALSSDTPAPGFGAGTTASASAGDCGN